MQRAAMLKVPGLRRGDCLRWVAGRPVRGGASTQEGARGGGAEPAPNPPVARGVLQRGYKGRGSQNGTGLGASALRVPFRGAERSQELLHGPVARRLHPECEVLRGEVRNMLDRVRDGRIQLGQQAAADVPPVGDPGSRRCPR